MTGGLKLCVLSIKDIVKQDTLLIAFTVTVMCGTMILVEYYNNYYCRIIVTPLPHDIVTVMLI